ncbi:hypothetical protein JCM11641_001272, partial [Rhodosporidiobolus odoratus]
MGAAVQTSGDIQVDAAAGPASTHSRASETPADDVPPMNTAASTSGDKTAQHSRKKGNGKGKEEEKTLDGTEKPPRKKKQKEDIRNFVLHPEHRRLPNYKATFYRLVKCDEAIGLV